MAAKDGLKELARGGARINGVETLAPRFRLPELNGSIMIHDGSIGSFVRFPFDGQTPTVHEVTRLTRAEDRSFKWSPYRCSTRPGAKVTFGKGGHVGMFPGDRRVYWRVGCPPGKYTCHPIARSGGIRVKSDEEGFRYLLAAEVCPFTRVGTVEGPTEWPTNGIPGEDMGVDGDAGINMAMAAHISSVGRRGAHAVEKTIRRLENGNPRGAVNFTLVIRLLEEALACRRYDFLDHNIGRPEFSGAFETIEDEHRSVSAFGVCPEFALKGSTEPDTTVGSAVLLLRSALSQSSPVVPTSSKDWAMLLASSLFGDPQRRIEAAVASYALAPTHVALCVIYNLREEPPPPSILLFPKSLGCILAGALVAHTRLESGSVTFAAMNCTDSDAMQAINEASEHEIPLSQIARRACVERLEQIASTIKNPGFCTEAVPMAADALQLLKHFGEFELIMSHVPGLCRVAKVPEMTSHIMDILLEIRAIPESVQIHQHALVERPLGRIRSNRPSWEQGGGAGKSERPLH